MSPPLHISDDVLYKCRRDRLLLRREASNKGVGAERIHHPRQPPGVAHNTPQGSGGKERLVALGCLRQAMADIGQAFLLSEWQDGRAHGDVLLQVPESVLREGMAQGEL